MRDLNKPVFSGGIGKHIQAIVYKVNNSIGGDRQDREQSEDYNLNREHLIVP